MTTVFTLLLSKIPAYITAVGTNPAQDRVAVSADENILLTLEVSRPWSPVAKVTVRVDHLPSDAVDSELDQVLSGWVIHRDTTLILSDGGQRPNKGRGWWCQAFSATQLCGTGAEIPP